MLSVKAQIVAGKLVCPASRQVLVEKNGQATQSNTSGPFIGLDHLRPSY